MNIIEKITASLPDLTKSERLIADYVLKNPKDIELYTITKIAELANVSKSAVLRFCQKLAYQGYSEFRYDMVHYLHKSDKKSPDQANPLIKSLDLYIQSIEQLKSLDFSILKEMVDCIIDSHQVYCVGVYKSSVVAQKFAYNFINQGKEVVVLKDMVEVNHLPFHIKNQAVIIIFSVSGASSQLNDFLKSNRGLKNQTYLITSSKRSSTSKLVGKTVVLPTNILLEGLLDPHAIHMIIVELLTQMYVEKKG